MTPNAPDEGSRVPGAVVVAALAVAVAVAAAAVVLGALAAADDPGLPASADAPWPAEGAPVDTALARAGERLFARGCAACHTVGGGRLSGPDLAGLLERREPDWIRGMVLSPDSMLRFDPVARALLAEYRLPMPASNLSPRELRAVVEHVRAAGSEGAP